MLLRQRLQAPCRSPCRCRGTSNLSVPGLHPAHSTYLCCLQSSARCQVVALSADGDGALDPLEDPNSRRLQRAQRRAARSATSEPQQDHSDAVEVGSGSEDDTADEPAAVQPSRLSRIAARRAQRGRGRRRVPAALVPGEIDMEEAEDVEDAVGVAHVNQAGPSDDAADEGSEDEESEYSDSALDAEDSNVSQLPASVLDTAIAQRRSSHQGASTSQPSRSQQHDRPDPVVLKESNPMYIPVLTDEDLDSDPPGHKSGYVAVIGRPNAGKSTLINAIVGQKLSIVTFKPQTTRHRVVGIASGPEYQMILFDTPGIMNEQRSKLDERMMAAVVSSIKAAEVIIAVVDSGDDPQEAVAMFQPGPDWSGPPMAVLLNKADVLQPEQIQQLEDWYKTNCRAEQVFVGSALSSSDPGVSAIKSWAVQKLPEGPTLYPKSMVSEQPERFFVSEIIREQIFLQYNKEIPYACQVLIDDFKEWPGKKDHIKALILVERESQAPILLGKGGSKIRQLGTAAREEIEEFLGRPVYLELSVKVSPSWRQQSDKLKDFGYFDPLYIT